MVVWLCVVVVYGVVFSGVVLLVEVEPIPPFSKCAILLVFVAQSTSHRCKSYVGF